MPFLAAKSANFCHRHALNPGLGDRVPHIVQFERLDDRRDHFHANFLLEGGSLDFNPSIIVPQAIPPVTGDEPCWTLD